MTELIFRQHSRTNWSPASYTANGNTNAFQAHTGFIIGPTLVRVRTAFDGTTPAALLGDATINGRFFGTSDVDLTATGLTEGVGAAGRYANVGRFLYTANTVIVIYWTQGGGGTTGFADWWLYQARTDPH